MLNDLIDNTVLMNLFRPNKKFIVVMDEVDGMTGSDRGGIAALIECIKSTRVPIVCICNDNDSTKLRSLLA
jgi:replication factor C subunit 1